MMGDRDRLRQALVNLLDNALRWTPAGGQVRVRLRMEGNEHDGQIRVLIEDTGPGIPAELRPRLWERGTTGDRNGHGLGLALVREIVEAHGGTARLVPGAGTTVELAFPRATEDAQHGDTETRSKTKGRYGSR